MAKKIAIILSAVVLGGTIAAQEARKELTELQLAKAELLKLQIQLASKEIQLGNCKVQVLQSQSPGLEQEFLKQMGADPKATWDWQTMSPKKP